MERWRPRGRRGRRESRESQGEKKGSGHRRARYGVLFTMGPSIPSSIGFMVSLAWLLHPHNKGECVVTPWRVIFTCQYIIV